MQFWYEGIDLATIEMLRELGLLNGITTTKNRLIEASSQPRKLLQNLLNIQKGFLAVDVGAHFTDGMVEEGKELSDLSSRVIVKIPAEKEGLAAIHRLTHARIPVMATDIKGPIQALLAIKAGATNLAFHPSSVEKGANLVQFLPHLRKNYLFDVQFLGLTKNCEEILQCIDSGIDGIALKQEMLSELLEINSFSLIAK